MVNHNVDVGADAADVGADVGADTDSVQPAGDPVDDVCIVGHGVSVIRFVCQTGAHEKECDPTYLDRDDPRFRDDEIPVVQLCPHHACSCDCDRAVASAMSYSSSSIDAPPLAARPQVSLLYGIGVMDNAQFGVAPDTDIAVSDVMRGDGSAALQASVDAQDGVDIDGNNDQRGRTRAIDEAFGVVDRELPRLSDDAKSTIDLCNIILGVDHAGVPGLKAHYVRFFNESIQDIERVPNIVSDPAWINVFDAMSARFMCAHCLEISQVKLRGCAACLLAEDRSSAPGFQRWWDRRWYCSRHCQKLDWPSHKADCAGYQLWFDIHARSRGRL